jgi:hypothetical protein
MSESESERAGKARAAALREQIDKLTGAKKPKADGDQAEKKPTNPRDAIHEWMAEHDKKPEK